MRRVEIAGSHYELGLEYGRIVSDNKLDWWWTPPSTAKLALVKGCEREISVHAPGFLEEIRGLADACRRDVDLVLSNMTVTYWEQPACNVVAVSGTQCRNGRTIFARNHDFDDADREWVTCFKTSPKNGLSSIGFGFADPGRYDGVNEAGLAIGGAAIWHRKKHQPGLRMNVVTRWVLDTFSDTPSAVDYLQRIPHHEGVSYLVADKAGCIARVEVAPEGVDVAMTKDGMLAAINQYQSPKMAGLDLEQPLGKENLVHRHKRRIPAWYEAHKGGLTWTSPRSYAATLKSASAIMARVGPSPSAPSILGSPSSAQARSMSRTGNRARTSTRLSSSTGRAVVGRQLRCVRAVP